MRLVLLQVGSNRPERRHYYLHECVRSIYNPDAHFVIDRVLRRRQRAGRREALVHFADYYGKYMPTGACVPPLSTHAHLQDRTRPPGSTRQPSCPTPSI